MLAQNRDFCLPDLHSTPLLGKGMVPLENCHAVWYGKFEWLGYPKVKNVEDMFICFDRIYERGGQTDTQTDTQTDSVW